MQDTCPEDVEALANNIQVLSWCCLLCVEILLPFFALSDALGCVVPGACHCCSAHHRTQSFPFQVIIEPHWPAVMRISSWSTAVVGEPSSICIKEAVGLSDAAAGKKPLVISYTLLFMHSFSEVLSLVPKE